MSHVPSTDMYVYCACIIARRWRW